MVARGAQSRAGVGVAGLGRWPAPHPLRPLQLDGQAALFGRSHPPGLTPLPLSALAFFLLKTAPLSTLVPSHQALPLGGSVTAWRKYRVVGKGKALRVQDLRLPSQRLALS